METFFIYLLKCGGIITLFYAIYGVLLKQETFFKQNRYFLLTGILVALLLPLLVYTKTIYVSANPSDTIIANTATANQTATEGVIHWTTILLYIYLAGASIFLGRFILQIASLIRLIRSSKLIKNKSFVMAETQEDVTPFSFFHYIVYNPNSHSKDELHTIIAHEKIHARQWHSIDILFIHLFSILLWVHPLIWGYKKAIGQNLEYIADGEAVKKVSCIKKYQYLLLNTSTPYYTMALTNHFFNSLIKKRIVMLNRSKSQQKNLWKYGIIFPFLIAFIFLFNINTVAQVRIVEEVIETDGQTTTVAEFSIDKNTTDKDLQKLKAEIEKEGGTFTYKGLKRNSDGEITAIKIEYTNTKGSLVTGSYSDTDGIQPIGFGAKKKGDIFIVSGDMHEDDNDIRIHGIGQHSDGDVMVIRKGKKHKGKGKNKKSIRVEKIIDSDDHEDNVFIFEHDGDDKDPMVIVDGKETTMKAFKKFDTDDIEKIEVVKGKKATDKYGDKAKDGVIIITTKDNK